VLICDGHLSENPITCEQQTAQQWMAFKKERTVREWLDTNSHPDPLTVYNDCDPLSEHREILLVMNDKTAVVMLKLALF